MQEPDKSIWLKFNFYHVERKFEVLEKALQLLQCKCEPCLRLSNQDFSTRKRDLHHSSTPWPDKDSHGMWKNKKTGPAQLIVEALEKPQ